MDPLTRIEKRLSEASTVDAAVAVFDAEISVLGYRYFDFFSFSASKMSNPEQACRFYAANYMDSPPWSYFPRTWPDGDPIVMASLHQTLPFDGVKLLQAAPASPTVLVQRGLAKLWNITHAWLIPLSTPHFLQIASLYMIDGDDEQFQATRMQSYVLASAMMHRLMALNPLEAQGEAEPVRLTKEETACLTAIAGGLKNAEIARELGVTPHTVRYHLKKLFKKLGVANRAEAAVVGLRLGLGG